MQLRGAMLYVKDLERMKRFYSDLLRGSPTNQDSTEAWAVFDTGGARFALHAVPAEIAKDIEITSPPIAREEAPVKLIFEIDDVEAARARLESLGARALRRPWQKPGEAFDAVDPEGNVFQVCAAGFDVRPLSRDEREEQQVTELLFSVYVDEGFTDRASATNFEAEQVRKRGDVFLAIANGEVLGMAVLARPDCEFRQIATSQEAELHLLSVKASSRGRGIGAALIRACEERALTLGFRAIVLSTQLSMLAAQRLYQRLGYQRNQSRDWQKSEGKSYLVFEKKL